MAQKLPLRGFKWVEKASQFNKLFIKSYNHDSVVGYFTEADVQSPEKLHELQNDLAFSLERMKTEKVDELVVK